jgi:hypothetical protein
MYLELGRRDVNWIDVLHGVLSVYFVKWPIPLAAQSEAWVYSLSLVGIAGSNSAGGIDVCLL